MAMKASEAYNNLLRRLGDVQQLLDAHTALTQFKRARKIAEKAGGGLAKISRIVDSLVADLGPGRRSEVDALNRAAIVLLCAHLQAFIEEIFTETARSLLRPYLFDVDALINQALSSFTNPQSYRIDRLFASIGFPTILKEVTWQGANNQSVKRRLSRLVELRNSIAHGKQESIHKAKVVEFMKFVILFAKKLDETILLESVLTNLVNPARRNQLTSKQSS